MVQITPMSRELETKQQNTKIQKQKSNKQTKNIDNNIHKQKKPSKLLYRFAFMILIFHIIYWEK